MRAACGVFVSLHRGAVSANLTVVFWAVLLHLAFCANQLQTATLRDRTRQSSTNKEHIGHENKR